jgi:hypothetical protein
MLLSDKLLGDSIYGFSDLRRACKNHTLRPEEAPSPQWADRWAGFVSIGKEGVTAARPEVYAALRVWLADP